MMMDNHLSKLNLKASKSQIISKLDPYLINSSIKKYNAHSIKIKKQSGIKINSFLLSYFKLEPLQ